MSYPSRVELTGRSMRDAPDLYAHSPRFDSHGVASRVLRESYLDANRVLPGGVLERAVMSVKWLHRVAVPYNQLDVPRRMWKPRLRGELEYIAQRVALGHQGAEAGMIGTGDAAVERHWFVEERAWFGLAKMNVVHRFLACVIRPPRGVLSLYLAGIRHQLNTHVRCLERDENWALRV